MNNFSKKILELPKIKSLFDFTLPQREKYYQSPIDWCSEILYFLLPDRFSDGQEMNKKVLPSGYSEIPELRPENWNWKNWFESGKNRFQGGTLNGITSKLDYLSELGITTIWIGPVFKQRVGKDDYHGYAIQDFLEVDPRFGTKADLVNLVKEAHDKNIRIILDVIFNHSGRNWLYADQPEKGEPTYYNWPYYHPFGSWLDEGEKSIETIVGYNDGVYPEELANENYYTRAGEGSLGNESPENISDPNVEYRRTDFCGLRDFNLDSGAMSYLLRVYKYWIALTDCDGFRIDTLKHVPKEQARNFCGAIKEFAINIGKNNFFLVGEVGGGKYFPVEYLEAVRHNLNACLDISSRDILCNVAKGLQEAKSYVGTAPDEWNPALGSSRLSAERYVTVLNDHDHVYGAKLRFSANASSNYQIVAGVAIQLLSLGVPCIYYGSEQAFAGPESSEVKWLPDYGSSDCYLRETMFGAEHPKASGKMGLSDYDNNLPGFGAFGTVGYHCFNQKHPAFIRIKHLIEISKKYVALSYGREYLRQISNFGYNFTDSKGGEIIAWSRILDDEEILCIVNSNGNDRRGGDVKVDANISLTYPNFYIIANTEEVAGANNKVNAIESVLKVKHKPDGIAYLEIRDIGPSEVIVLTNKK